MARRSGLPPSTLRFYEEKGLISSIGRRGLHRTFDSDVLERLALIALGRAAGFTLNEIAEVFTPNGQPRIERQRLLSKAAELDKTIRSLTDMRDGLLHAATCRAPNVIECPSFRRILQAAASGPVRTRGKRALAKHSLVSATRPARADRAGSRPPEKVAPRRSTDRRRRLT
ncbi:MAG TPA: helix-turn-helix domain-containing protein [Polyangiaceae bacterium]|nr:helix-turn-helix domain-containing protein [Polyangiaceae bacterium]